MSRRKATPFDGLFGVTPKRLPGSAGVTVVVAGQPVRDVREIERRLVDADRDDDAVAEARKLRAAVEKARERAHFQRQRVNGTDHHTRGNDVPQEAAERREYMRQWRRRNRKHLREYGAAWARETYRQDPQRFRDATRRYYERNREAILARMKAKRDAAKAERLQARAQDIPGEQQS